MYSQPARKFTAKNIQENFQVHYFNEMFGGEGFWQKDDFPSRHDIILVQQIHKKDQLRLGKAYFQI